MTIRGADNTFDTLHETPRETHETHRSTTLPKPRYSPRSSHRINMAECTKKMDQELALLDNPIVTEPIVTKSTGAARTPTKYTGAARKPTKYAGAARQPTKLTTSAAEHEARHAALRTPTKDITSAARRMNISMIGAASFNHLVQQSQKNPSRTQIFSVTLQDINIALAPKKHSDPATKLPTEYHNFLDVFSRKDADVLSKHRPQYDHAIKLMKGKTPTWGPLYSMSADELKVLKAYIEKMVDKGFI